MAQHLCYTFHYFNFLFLPLHHQIKRFMETRARSEFSFLYHLTPSVGMQLLTMKVGQRKSLPTTKSEDLHDPRPQMIPRLALEYPLSGPQLIR